MSNPLALIIEDDENQAELFTIALQAALFDTETIMDGQKALDRLTEVVPAMVILDLHLPNVSGREILAWIRKEKRLRNTKVILATADAVQADALQEQGDITLLKPISPTQLKELSSRFRP